MKLEILGDQVTVTLSKRNLLALLSKVDADHSAKTIYKLGQGNNGELTLVLKTETDKEHYSFVHPGQMVDWSEEFIAIFDDETVA